MCFGNLINLGTKSEMDFYSKREIRLVNLFALIAFISSVAGIMTVFFINARYPTVIALFSIFTALSVILFNFKGYNDVATYIFVLTTNASIFIINEQYITSVGNYLYYFPLIFCVALVHNPTRSNTRTIIFFSIIAVSFLCSWVFTISSLRNLTVTDEDNRVLLIYNSCFTFFLTIILVYLVVKLINRQNNEAISLLRKEQEAQTVIAQSLKDKDVLLAEIQHRVKNNLAIISGLLNLQTEKAPCEVSRLLMLESRNRVMSIAMVHERLYKKDNLAKIDLKLYLSELVAEIIKSFPIKAQQIEIQEELDKVDMEITKAVPIGLIINEALTNSLKHAFTEANKNPIIKIKMQLIYDRIQICLSDNGVGFCSSEDRHETALGLSLIESLADQIDANVVFKNETGACISLVMPV